MWRFVAHRFIVSSLAKASAASAAPGRPGDRARAIAAALGVALMAGCDPVISPSSDAAPPTDGIPDARPPDATPVCTPACTSEHDLLECKADGSTKTVWCPLGCVMNAKASCRSIVASNGVDAGDLMGTSKGIYIPEDAQAIIDTDSGLITVEGETWREAGVGVESGIGFHYRADDLSVFAASNFTMKPGSSLRARGERPLLILTNGYVQIEGTIDVSAGCDLGPSLRYCGGPGGGDGADDQNPAMGCGPGGNGSVSDTRDAYGGGGGGGGPGQAGAAGASAEDAAGGSGGQACEASVTPLRGGSGGGRAGFDPDDDYDYDRVSGGGGGGALQIISLSFSIRLEGIAVIDAGGSGGGGSTFGSGGGGGAGGVILLEAPRVIIEEGAKLAANGGGGGGASPGEDGRLDGAQAQGGSGGGGLGGALAGAPTAGTLRAGMFGGGGGGATGLIRLRAVADQCKIESTEVSPAAVCIEPEIE